MRKKAVKRYSILFVLWIAVTTVLIKIFIGGNFGLASFIFVLMYIPIYIIAAALFGLILVNILLKEETKEDSIASKEGRDISKT